MTGEGARDTIDRGRRKEEPLIFDSVSSSPADDTFAAGAQPGAGTFYCVECGSDLCLEGPQRLPPCPGCGGRRFRRESMFEQLRERRHATAEIALPRPSDPPSWLREARRAPPGRGRRLALRTERGEIVVHAIERGWTRIGRSATADLRLDDPSVSRRHALIVAEPGKRLRVLDDRSLNGVLINGEPVEWAALKDGDELAIGRYKLYVLDG